MNDYNQQDFCIMSVIISEIALTIKLSNEEAGNSYYQVLKD